MKELDSKDFGRFVKSLRSSEIGWMCKTDGGPAALTNNVQSN